MGESKMGVPKPRPLRDSPASPILPGVRRLEPIISAQYADVMATKYIHQLTDWPKFRRDHSALAGRLATVHHRQGRLIGRMKVLGFTLRRAEILIEEVIKSSEIEARSSM